MTLDDYFDYGSNFDLGGYSDIDDAYNIYLSDDTPYGSINQNVDSSKTIVNPDGSTYFYNKLGNFLGGVGSAGQVITSGGLGQFGSVLKNLFSGRGDLGSLGQMAAFGGLSALLNKIGGGGRSQAPVGYQGGIPQYTVERTQMPYQTGQQNEMLRLKQAAQDAMSTGATQDQVRNAAFRTYGISPSQFDQAMQTQGTYRRPGQGGITYFSPIQYTKTGKDLGAAPVAPPVATPAVETQETISAAHGGYMPGGIAMLAGGRYLRGPGDGVSDSIPAKFKQSGQPARLADGEFVIDARTVSEIGNGSSEAGARKLYAMMDRVHKARKTAKRGKPSGADKFLPK